MAENKNTKSEKMYSEKEVKNLIAQAISEVMAKNIGNTIVVKENKERVTLLFLGAIGKGTSVDIGLNNIIFTKSGMTKTILKEDFIEKRTPLMDRLIENRNLIVVNGLTDEERDLYGVLYKDGELLTEETYRRLLSYDKDTIIRIYKQLCPEHKRIVATMYIDAFEANDNRVNLSVVSELNKLSKEVDEDGLLTPVVKALQEREMK